MKRLFKHEFYKLFQSVTLKVLIAVAGGIALLSALSMVLVRFISDAVLGGMELTQGYASVHTAMADSTLHIYFGVLIAMIVCSELKNRTMKNTALADFSRGEIYFAKFLAMITGITIIIGISTIIYVGTYLLLFGWGQAVTVTSVLKNGVAIFFMGLLLCYAVAAMLNFFAYLTKNTALVILIAILMPIALLIILGIVSIISTNAVNFLMRFTYPYTLSSYFFEQTLTNFAYYLVTVLVMLVGFIWGGYALFKKQEIK